MPQDKITIIGAGLVGSLLALLLSKKKYTVEVFEKRPDMRKNDTGGGRSINLALSMRGWRALEMANIASEIKKIALPMHGRLMHSQSGELTFQSYGKENEAIYSVSRAILNKKLMDEAEKEGVKFHFNHKCENVDSKNAIAEFKNELNDTGVRIKSDVIFGTDGAFSATRSGFLKSDRFSYSQQYLTHGYKELEVRPSKNGDFQMRDDVLHIWPRGNYMLIALPNPDKTFTCTLFFPFKGDPSFDTIKNDSQIETFFDSQFKDVKELMPDLHDMFHQNPTSSLVTIKCYPWLFDDKVCLLGDASHAIVPFYGQGMNSGFEDCSVLMDILEEHDNWPSTLQAFQKSRKPNADAISELAMKNFIEMRDSVANEKFLLQKKIESKINDLYPDRWMPLYSMVTFSHLPYAEALRKGQIQHALMQEVLGIKEIENIYLKPEFKDIIRPYVERLEEEANQMGKQTAVYR